MVTLQKAILQICMSAMASFGFSVLYNVRGKKLLLNTLGAAMAWAIYVALWDPLPSVTTRYFICACFAALYAELLARKLKTPATTFMMPVIISLIPGSSLYRTMRYGLHKEWMACLRQGLHTFKLALALALGCAVVLTAFNVLARLRSGHKKEGQRL